MRIAVTSDIHTDITPANKHIVKHLVAVVEETRPDALIICGDVSPNLLEISRTFSAFQELSFPCHKFFVSGNHDIWVNENNVLTSKQKYETITEVCAECDFHHLEGGPVIIDGVGFCGTIGWYDYSFKQDKYGVPLSQYESKRYGNSIWNDVNYAKWGCSDIELAHQFEDELQAQINAIKDGVSQIIVATHHLPFQENVLYRGELPWDFFSAFMGSRGLGEICVNEPLVTHVLFGHTHFKNPYRRDIKGVIAISSPVGYLYNKSKRSLPKYAREHLTIFEVSGGRTNEIQTT